VPPRVGPPRRAGSRPARRRAAPERHLEAQPRARRRRRSGRGGRAVLPHVHPPRAPGMPHDGCDRARAGPAAGDTAPPARMDDGGAGEGWSGSLARRVRSTHGRRRRARDRGGGPRASPRGGQRGRPSAAPWAFPFVGLWLFSPLVGWWISLPQEDTGAEPLGDDDARTLRKTARRTWHFFETFVGAEDHALPPDNFQEDPRPVVAHRTSPTNIGLYLLSTFAAHA